MRTQLAREPKIRRIYELISEIITSEILISIGFFPHPVNIVISSTVW